jgi:hypothetical protein
MADEVTGAELKVRNFELPVLGTDDIEDDHTVALDSLTSGPGGATPKILSERGISKLSYASGAPIPAGPNPEDQPRVPVGIRSRVKYYPLADLVSGYGSLYLGPKASNPSVDNYGNPLQIGSTYYNVSQQAIFVFNNARRWVLASNAYPGALRAYYYFPAVDTSVLPVGGAGQPDARGNVFEVNISGGVTAVDPINVYMNGALLANGVDYTVVEGTSGSGDYITLIRPICGGSVAVIQVFDKPDVTFALDAVAINSDTWIFNGVTQLFPLRQHDTTPVIPENAVNCLVVQNGRVIEPNVEFTVSGSDIFFAVAPLAGDNVWVTVGLPITAGYTSPLALNSDLQALQVRVAALEAQVAGLLEP